MLTLPIKKEWLDMILSGEKKEEYRAITRYWTKRFQSIILLDAHGLPVRQSRVIKLRAGYRKDSPAAKVRVTISKGFGNPAWGAIPGVTYWKLRIEEVIKP